MAVVDCAITTKVVMILIIFSGFVQAVSLQREPLCARPINGCASLLFSQQSCQSWSGC